MFNFDGVTITFCIMTPCEKINIASEDFINYRVTSQSNHCCQIRILFGERPGISIIICCSFLRREHLIVLYVYVGITVLT